MDGNRAAIKWRFPIDFCPGIFACNNEPTPGTPVYNAKTPTGLQAQLVLCITGGIICFLLFCILRVRWSAMYSPRLRMKKHAPDPLPTSMFGWIIPLLQLPHSVVLEKVGLDAVVMLQFLLMGAKLFALCGFFGTVVLYPISRMGGDFTNTTDPEFTTTFGIFNPYLLSPTTQPLPTLPNSSLSFLWVYLFFTYFFCIATFYFTFLNYRDYILIRQEFQLRLANTLPSRTIFVTGIPPNLRSDRKLADYFEQLGIGVVDSVHMIRHMGRLLDFIKERGRFLRLLETAYAKFWGNPCRDVHYNPDELLAEAEQTPGQGLATISWAPCHDRHRELPVANDHIPSEAETSRDRPTIQNGFMGCSGKCVDEIEYYTKQFNEMDSMVIRARKHGKFLPTSVGFVTFEDTVSATVASQVLIDETPFRLRAQLAPEPRDVLWENISMHDRERFIRKAMIACVLLILVFFWIIPISYLSAMTNENALRNYFPWLMDLASKSKILRQIVLGFLPTLAVVIFTAVLPYIFNMLSYVEGFQTRSETDESTFSKHFFFLLFNVLLVFTISSALFKTLTDILEDPRQIASILAARLPSVAPFFVNYTVLQGMLLLPIQLLQIGPVIVQLFSRTFMAKTPRDHAEVLAPRMYNYGWGYPLPVFMFVVLLVYSTIAPLILVFGTIYFCLAYLVIKYQLLYVYFHSYEVAGRMWPLVFTRIIVGLLIFELTSSGLFVLNKAYPLAILCVPLIIMTVLFKVGMDAAYSSSSHNMPLHLLTQVLGPPSRIDRCQTQEGSTSASAPNLESPTLAATTSTSTTGPSNAAPTGDSPPNMIRRRHTVLDDDDYVAAPRQFTNFKQPPMTLLDGVLNTGMKRYGHPALLGVLPQLWLPIKAKKPEGPSALSSIPSPPDDSGIKPLSTTDRGLPESSDERQPLLSRPNTIPTYLNNQSGEIPDSAQSTDDEDEQGTYYHHPERRHTRVLSTRSRGTIYSSSPS